MGPLNSLLALIALLVALLTAALLCRFQAPPSVSGRYAPIDGLRGFLAFAVFLHHASSWYLYLRTGQWSGYQSRLYEHFGLSAVAMFFMITAFLFFSKLIDADRRPIDWPKLFTSRVLRLVPLYLFAMAVLFTFVAIQSGWHLQAPPEQLLIDAVTWLGFSAYGQPDLNAVADTRWMIAGVTWSLPYEWAFYLALPLGALLLRRRPPLGWVFIGTVGAIFFAAPLGYFQAWFAFLGGIIASFAVRSPRLRTLLAGPIGTVIMCLSIGFTATLSPEQRGRPVLLLLTIIFIVLTCGNSLFGILVSSAARKLGELSYSLYLLHGFVLYAVFRFVIGFDTARSLSPEQHWLVVLACVPVLVGLCSLTYRFIELPGINSSASITGWMKRRSLV